MSTEARPPRPHVLVFCLDELRADHLGCMGNPLVRTPHIDRLAARGTVFRRAYCNNPICMPARHSLFTGLLPRDHGVRVNGQRQHPGLPLLPQLLQDRGYRTHAAGKLHLSAWVPGVKPPRPDRFPECLEYWQAGWIHEFPTPYCGFETVDFVGGHGSYVYGDYIPWLKSRGGDPAMLGPEQALEPPSGAPSCYKMSLPQELHYNRYIADSAIRVIEKTPPTRPFFIWCSYPDPHLPVAPPAPYCDLYPPRELPLPVTRAGEEDDLPPFYRDIFAGKLRPNGVENRRLPAAHLKDMVALTYGMITHVDYEIGRVLAALEASGKAADTLVVLLADHGDMMGDHGLLWKAFYTFRGCIQVPLIVAGLDFPGGRATEALAAQIDFMPSILDCCGIPAPGTTEAAAQTPFERGAVRPLAPYPGRSWRGILEGRVASIRDHVVIENDDPTTGLQPRAVVTARHRLTVYPGTEHGELFDLTDDPNELQNLWYRPEARDLRAALIYQLLQEYSLRTPWHPIPSWNA